MDLLKSGSLGEREKGGVVFAIAYTPLFWS